VEQGPPPVAKWSKESGPGAVTFADPKALITTATFSTPGPHAAVVQIDGEELGRARFYIMESEPEEGLV
jgi:hypothetical protein